MRTMVGTVPRSSDAGMQGLTLDEFEDQRHVIGGWPHIRFDKVLDGACQPLE